MLHTVEWNTCDVNVDEITEKNLLQIEVLFHNQILQEHDEKTVSDEDKQMVSCSQLSGSYVYHLPRD
jgi:hypothetical protein